MADDALFGQDGTQPPPPPPLLGDALAGLVTGYLYSDTTIAAPDETHWKQEALPPARVEVRRARPVAARRVAVTPPSGSVTPAQFAVAAPLPSRLPAEKRPTVPRTTPVKPAPPARANQRKTIGSQAPTKRSGGAGCAIFLIMVLVIIGVFVVLGVLLGHGDAGLSGGGGGG